MRVNEKQKSIIEKAKKYLYKKDNNKFTNRLSVLLYLNSWDPATLGHSYVKWKLSSEKSLFWFITKWLKKIISFKNYKNVDIYNNKNSIDVNCKNLVVSWCKLSDFDENGNYYDRYFNYNSDNSENIIWLLVSLDNKIPSLINNNVVVCYSRKTTLLSSATLLIKLIFKSFRNNIPKAKSNIFDDIAPETFFAENMAKIVCELNNKHTFNKVIQPYEAQPFQHAINLVLKKAKNKVNLIGYLHSVLPALPTDLIYRQGAPDVLFVHGIGQIEILNRFLNWDNNKLHFLPSIRYKQHIAESFSDWIFLPYNFNNSKKILFELDTYLNTLPDCFLPIMKIRCHPAKLNSKSHIKLINSINSLLIKYKIKFDSNVEKKISFFIGATASIIEALERKVEVIHITSDPIFESHQSFIWEYLNVSKITNNTYEYSFKKNGSYITLGNKEDSILNLI